MNHTKGQLALNKMSQIYKDWRWFGKDKLQSFILVMVDTQHLFSLNYPEIDIEHQIGNSILR